MAAISSAFPLGDPVPEQLLRRPHLAGEVDAEPLHGDLVLRRAVDVDYYIGMGETAYGSLHESIHSSGAASLTGDLFDNLCQKFAVLVDLLGEMSEMSGVKTNSDVLRAYEIWLKTGSERARKQLVRSGIHPLTALNAQVAH